MRVFKLVTAIGTMILFPGLVGAQQSGEAARPKRTRHAQVQAAPEDAGTAGSWRSFDATSTGNFRTAPFHPPIAVESAGGSEAPLVERVPEASGPSTGARSSLSGAVPELAARQM